MKTNLIVILILLFFQGHTQNSAVNTQKKNSIELSAGVFNTANYKMPLSLVSELGYSRNIGNFVRLGATYRYGKFKNSFNDYGVKIGFLPVPIFVKNDNFNNNWEFELNMNYFYQTQQGRDSANKWFIIKQHLFFARLGMSRRIKNNLFTRCNIDVWNSNQVFLGVLYKF